MNIGLKGAWKRTKGCRLRYRIKEFIWDIKDAWRRAWRGYDSVDISDMNQCFIEKYKVILKRYRDTHHCLFNIPEKYRKMFDSRLHFTGEETDTILDMMIFHLEMMNENYVEKVLYGKNIYDKDYDWGIRTTNDYKRISSIMNQNKEAFMKLFNDFFWELWD